MTLSAMTSALDAHLVSCCSNRADLGTLLEAAGPPTPCSLLPTSHPTPVTSDCPKGDHIVWRCWGQLYKLVRGNQEAEKNKEKKADDTGQAPQEVNFCLSLFPLEAELIVQ